MKNITFVLTILFIGVFSLALQAKSDSVDFDKKTGTYKETNIFPFGTYTADPKAELCFFVIMASPTQIPCENLAKRPGWESVITWVKAKK